MTPQEANRRAEELWARLPTARLGQQLEPLVAAHVELVRKTIAAHPPIEPAYCLALNPVQEDEEVELVEYAYGLQSDREKMLAEGDSLDVWNAAFFDQYVDAVGPKPPAENALRRQLNRDAEIVNFDYWLLCELARRLNQIGAAPPGATSDFVFYFFDHTIDEDFQLGLAYSTPLPIYQQLAEKGLAAPDEVNPSLYWLDFGLK